MWKRHKHSRTAVVNEQDNVVASCKWTDNTRDGLELLKEQLATCRLIENVPRMLEFIKKHKTLSQEACDIIDAIEYNEEDEKFLEEMN